VHHGDAITIIFFAVKGKFYQSTVFLLSNWLCRTQLIGYNSTRIREVRREYTVEAEEEK